MSGSSLNDLFTVIVSRSYELSKKEDNRMPLTILFRKAIKKTMKEMRYGEKRDLKLDLSDDFSDLVVINLIIMGAEESYTADEMRGFILSLKNNDEEDDSLFD